MLRIFFKTCLGLSYFLIFLSSVLAPLVLKASTDEDDRFLYKKISKIDRLLEQHPLDEHVAYYPYVQFLTLALRNVCEYKSDEPFLVQYPDVSFNYMDLYQSLAKSLGSMAYNQKDPMWAHLGGTFFSLALKSLKADEDWMIVLKYMWPEFKEQVQSGVDYEWFTYFCDRLSILMTPNKLRGLHSQFNTFFDQRAAYLATRLGHDKIPLWYRQIDFEILSCRYGNFYTQYYFNTDALVRQFPGIVMLPYPFDCGVLGLVKTMPEVGENNFWPLGWSFKEVMADGARMTPLVFRAHDKQHLEAFIFWQTNMEYVYEAGILEIEMLEIKKLEAKKLADKRQFFTKLKRTFIEIVEGEEEFYRKRMYAFFSFYVLHEGIVGLKHKVESLLLGRIFAGLNSEIFKDKKYFFDHLAEDVQQAALQENAHALTGTIIPYWDGFRMQLVNLWPNVKEDWMAAACYGFTITSKDVSKVTKKDFLSFDNCVHPFEEKPLLVPSENDLEKLLIVSKEEKEAIKESGLTSVIQLISYGSVLEVDPEKIKFFDLSGDLSKLN